MCTVCKKPEYDPTPARMKYPHRVDYIRGRKLLLSALAGEAKYTTHAAEALAHIRNNADRQYLALSIDDHNAVSYSPKGVHRHDHKKRRRTKLGRWLGAQDWAKGWSESSRERLTNAIMGRVRPLDECVTIVSGRAITAAYRESFGACSCMTGDDASLTEVYAANPYRVSLVKYDNGGTQARALLWQTEEGPRVLDRIYPNSGPHISHLERWAKQEGIEFRSHQGMPSASKPPFKKPYTVEIRWEQESNMPYMDSFTSGDWDGDTLTLRTGGRGDVDFMSTDGSHDAQSESNRVQCEGCGDRIDPEDSRSDDSGDCYCVSCYGERYTGCSRCDRELWIEGGDYVNCGSEVYCDRCAERHLSRCERCEEYSRDSTTTVTLDGGGTAEWCDECASNYAGECIDCGDRHDNLDSSNRCPDCCEAEDTEDATSVETPDPLETPPEGWTGGMVNPVLNDVPTPVYGIVHPSTLWAIHPTYRNNGERVCGEFSLLHVPSGLAAVTQKTDIPALVAAVPQFMALAGDWTSPTPMETGIDRAACRSIVSAIH